MPFAAMLAAYASIDASPCGVLRAFFGDFLSLLSGMKRSVPLSATISTFLADMINLLFRAWVQSAPRACTPARRRDRGSKGQGRPGRRGITRPAQADSDGGSGPVLTSARKVGETAPAGPGSSGTSPLPARGRSP